MRALLTIVIFSLSFGAVNDMADARPYDSRDRYWAWHSPWCLRTDGMEDCGYATLSQCLVSRSGVGGSCGPNAFYVPSPGLVKLRKSKRIAP
jgi:hypothetical protein